MLLCRDVNSIDLTNSLLNNRSPANKALFQATIIPTEALTEGKNSKK
jgi:hypothetical protein